MAMYVYSTEGEPVGFVFGTDIYDLDGAPLGRIVGCRVHRFDGSYVGEVAMPKEGFTAFFVELSWDSGLPAAPFKFTTEVSIVPDTLPFKWADAAAKYADTAPK